MQETFNRRLDLDIDITTMRTMRNEGKNNKEIALACGCTTATVRRYLGNMTKEERSKINMKVSHSRTPEQVRGRTYHKTKLANKESIIHSSEDLKPIRNLNIVSLMFQLQGKFHYYFVDSMEKKITLSREGAEDLTVTLDELGNFIDELEELYTVIGTTRK